MLGAWERGENKSSTRQHEYFELSRLESEDWAALAKILQALLYFGLIWQL